MNKWLVIASLCGASMGLWSCAELSLGPDPKGTAPTAVYDAFWQTYAQNYNAFKARNVNWDSLYAVYRPQVTDQLTDQQLLELIQKTIQPLHDNHVVVQSTKVGTAFSYVPTANVDFPGLSLIRTRYAPELQSISSQISYATIKPQVGYLYIGGFRNEPGFAQIDQVLESMKEYKAIIIDVRDDTGGNDANGRLVAGRFTTNTVLFGYEQFRSGAAPTDFSGYDGLYLASRGSWQFTKPVFLLTNRYVFSAGNSFVMMMRALPQVSQIGETTGDGVAGPTFRELANGWICGVPDKLTSLPNKQVVDGVGVRPTIRVSNGGTLDRDPILETALSLADKL